MVVLVLQLLYTVLQSWNTWQLRWVINQILHVYILKCQNLHGKVVKTRFEKSLFTSAVSRPPSGFIVTQYRLAIDSSCNIISNQTLQWEFEEMFISIFRCNVQNKGLKQSVLSKFAGDSKWREPWCFSRKSPRVTFHACSFVEWSVMMFGWGWSFLFWGLVFFVGYAVVLNSVGDVLSTCGILWRQ